MSFLTPALFQSTTSARPHVHFTSACPQPEHLGMQCSPPQGWSGTWTGDSSPQTSHLNPSVGPLHVLHSAIALPPYVNLRFSLRDRRHSTPTPNQQQPPTSPRHQATTNETMPPIPQPRRRPQTQSGEQVVSDGVATERGRPRAPCRQPPLAPQSRAWENSTRTASMGRCRLTKISRRPTSY